LGLIVRRITSQDTQTNNTPPNKSNPSNQSSLEQPLGQNIPNHVMARLKRVAAVGVASALIVGWLGSFRNEVIRTRRRILLNNHHNHNDHNDHDSSLSSNGQGPSSSEEMASKEVLVPPPPHPPTIAQTTTGTGDNRDRMGVAVAVPRDKTLCPICLEKRVNPVASSSGYVFCHKCLVLYIRENGNQCPVTSMPCERSQIVPLFEPNETTTTYT
jgi:hypothetical protein